MEEDVSAKERPLEMTARGLAERETMGKMMGKERGGKCVVCIVKKSWMQHNWQANRQGGKQVEGGSERQSWIRWEDGAGVALPGDESVSHFTLAR